jgi:enoyl-CoA hydratase/carnithine racemase
MIELERRGEVFVLHLGDGDNRFDARTVPAIDGALDEVEKAVTGDEAVPAALVTTASGKIWSNGLDLDHMAGLDDARPYLASVERLFARWLRLPVLTVAAIGGHAFAAGAMLALAHDERIMRADRGWFCLPEVDLGMSFSPGMAALIGAKLAQPALHRLAVLGERLAGPAAVAAGAVDAVADEGAVLDTAVERAAALASRAGPTVVALRRNFYRSAIAALDPPS